MCVDTCLREAHRGRGYTLVVCLRRGISKARQLECSTSDGDFADQIEDPPDDGDTTIVSLHAEPIVVHSPLCNGDIRGYGSGDRDSERG